MSDLRPGGVLEYPNTLLMNTPHHRISPTPQANNGHPTGMLQCLRALTPARRLSHLETLRLAERQATLLRHLLGITSDAFPLERLDQIPRIRIAYIPDLPIPATCFWGRKTWHIHIRDTLSRAQRGELVLHQLKHIIDHPVRSAVEDPRPLIRDGQRELTADYFAACVLIPEDQLRAADTADHADLAERFDVDQAQLEHRLSETGLTATLSTRERRTA